MIHGNILKRKSHKAQLLELIRQHPDMKIEKIVGMFSSHTGISHKTIYIYVNELRDEGKLNRVDKK